MGTPDIISTDGNMYDVKSVVVNSKITNTYWVVNPYKMQIYYSIGFKKRILMGTKLINFVNRLNKRYESYKKPDVRVFANILNRILCK